MANKVQKTVVLITAKDEKEAGKIGRCLVKDRLVACVNIIPNIDSIYWWEGKVEEDKEALIIAKTKSNLVHKIIEEVKSLHSYTCPEIISLPIKNGNPDYLTWIEKEVK